MSKINLITFIVLIVASTLAINTCNSLCHVPTVRRVTASDTLVVGQHIDLANWDIEEWDEYQMVLSHKTDTLADQIIVSSVDTMYLGLSTQ